MKFVEVEMTGGLGNQLFKWSNGFRIAQENNATLILNTSFYTRLKKSPLTTKRVFELSTIQGINESFYENKLHGFLNPKLQRIGLATKFVHLLTEDTAHPSERAPYSLVRGNFEALKYLPNRNTIRKMFRLNEVSQQTKEFTEMFTKNQAIAIHVRLGDFLKFPEVYNILPEEYYLEALRITRNHFPHAICHLFTDDEEGARNLYPNLLTEINSICTSSEIPSRDIMLLMSKANAIICANSTFSWWASFLASEQTLSIIPSKFNKILGDTTAESLQMPSQIMLHV